MSRIAEQPQTAGRSNRPEAGVDPAPAMRARLAGGIAFSAFSLLVIVGMPVFLTQAVGSRWPDRGPVLHDFQTLHLRSDTELLFGGIALAGWGLWLVFMVMVLYAVIGAIGDVLRWGVAAETWRDASNPVRWLAGLLIGAVAALWPTAENAVPPEPVDQTVASRTLTDDELAHVTAGYAAGDAPLVAAAQTEPAVDDAGPVTHVIGPTDSLYSLAKEYLGKGVRWPEIWELNQGITMSNGQPFIDPDFITDGTVVTIPTNAEPAPTGPEDSTATIHHVEAGQHLYGLAEDYYGDGDLWPRIWQANQGRTFADGRTFTDPDRIFTDWDLYIPAKSESLQPDNSEPESGDNNTAPDPDAELEGEGEVTIPDSETPIAPGEHDTPSAAGDDTTAPAEPTESDREANEAEATSSIPIGVWLGTGTFLAASTAALLAARTKKRRKAPDPKLVRQDRPVTGRLADLEAMIEPEQHRLTRPAEPEPHPADPSIQDLTFTDLPIGADRSRMVDLADLAVPALGLTGPGHRSAVRAAIITALDTDHPVTVTAQAADILDIDPDTGAVRCTEDLDDALAAPAQERTEASGLVICTGEDIDRIDTEALAEHLALNGDRVMVLGQCPIGPTAVIDADGTVQGDTRPVAGAEQFYIADADLFHDVLAGHTGTAEAPADTEVFELSDEDEDAEPEPDGRPAAQDHSEAEDPPDAAPGTGFRLCVFGDVDLYYDGVPVKLKQRARALTLLGALACAEDGRTMEELLDIVTPDRPLKGAREYVNIIKSNLRATVRELAGDDTLDPVPYDEKTATFRLDTDLIATDLADIDAAEQQAALATNPAEQIAALERLVRLHTGDLAPDIEHLADLRHDYRDAIQRACTRLADHYAEHGDAAKAAKYRSMLTATKPTDRDDRRS
jgi:nucleoid-associated protein YgaU/DNA-binding SARP family transcriptional activator